MTLPLSFGIALPQVVDDTAPSAELVTRYARDAETLGFSHLWVSELTSAPVLDPLHMLTFAAAATSTIKLGVAIVLVPLRVPVQLARDTATLDHLSDGRLILGVGLGSNRDLYKQYGLTSEGRLDRYTQGLDALEQLWRGGPIEVGDDFWDLCEATAIPPVQLPHPPIWFGARRGAALKRAALRGDGWIVSGSAPAVEFKNAMDDMRDHLEAAGKNPDTFPIASRVYLAVTTDRTRTMDRMRTWFGDNYGRPEMAETVGVVGDPDDVAEELTRQRDAGVNHLLLNPVFDEEEHLHALVKDVLPRVV